MEFRGAHVHQRVPGGQKSFERDVTPYLAGLRLHADLLDAPDEDFHAGVTRAYDATLPPLFQMAAAEGFAAGWKP